MRACWSLRILMMLCFLGLALQGCGGGGGGGDNSKTTALDFSGTWSGTYNSIDMLYLVKQSGNSVTVYRAEPISDQWLSNITYAVDASGNTAKVSTYGNGYYMGYSTWTKLNDTTISVYLNSCVPAPGFGCGAADGTILTLTKSTAPAALFIDKGNGTIYDVTNNLSWLKNADCYSYKPYSDLTIINALAEGQCGLTDGSKAGDWRLPTSSEFKVYFDEGYRKNSLNTVGFSNLQRVYWTSTPYAGSADAAPFYGADLERGYSIGFSPKNIALTVWPVRTGL